MNSPLITKPFLHLTENHHLGFSKFKQLRLENTVMTVNTGPSSSIHLQLYLSKTKKNMTKLTKCFSVPKLPHPASLPDL